MVIDETVINTSSREKESSEQVSASGIGVDRDNRLVHGVVRRKGSSVRGEGDPAVLPTVLSNVELSFCWEDAESWSRSVVLSTGLSGWLRPSVEKIGRRGEGFGKGCSQRRDQREVLVPHAIGRHCQFQRPVEGGAREGERPR